MKNDNVVYDMDDKYRSMFFAGQILIHLMVFTVPFMVIMKGIVNAMQYYNCTPAIFGFIPIVMLLVMKIEFFFPMNETIDLINYAQYKFKKVKK